MEALTNNKPLRIVLYFGMALLTSVLFRLDIIKIPLTLPYANYAMGLLGAVGPFIGGLIMKRALGYSDKMSFFGLFGVKSIVLLLIPAICFAFFGTINNSHIEGFGLGLYIAAYGLLEETGWRGYLQQEFTDSKPFIKYSITAVFWYTWHLTFLGSTTVADEIVIFAILLVSSIGIGILADRTKSIVFAACFHIIGNIFSFSSEITSKISLNTRLMALGISLIIWIIAFKSIKTDKTVVLSKV